LTAFYLGPLPITSISWLADPFRSRPTCHRRACLLQCWQRRWVPLPFLPYSYAHVW